jgi:hypothetical protein
MDLNSITKSAGGVGGLMAGPRTAHTSLSIMIHAAMSYSCGAYTTNSMILFYIYWYSAQYPSSSAFDGASKSHTKVF